MRRPAAARNAPRERAASPPLLAWLLASPVLLVALIPLIANWRAASRRDDVDTLAFAHDLLDSVEPYGILVTGGDNDTFPLWYAQEVEGIRRDVVVVVTSLAGTDWFVRQLIRNPIREYDAAKGPAIYRGKTWPKPTLPPLPITLDEADRIPPAVELREPSVFRAGNIEARIEPRVLTKGDIAVLQMIKSDTGRPVYFARTTGAYAEELGLGPYMLTQGLARKLMSDVPPPGKDTVLVQGQGFVDVPRTEALWTQVFRAPAALIAKDRWVDRASVNSPMLYIATGALLAELLDREGRTRLGDSVMRTTHAIAKAVRLDDLFRDAPGDRAPSDSPEARQVPARR